MFGTHDLALFMLAALALNAMPGVGAGGAPFALLAARLALPERT